MTSQDGDDLTDLAVDQSPNVVTGHVRGDRTTFTYEVEMMTYAAGLSTEGESESVQRSSSTRGFNEAGDATRGRGSAQEDSSISNILARNSEVFTSTRLRRLRCGMPAPVSMFQRLATHSTCCTG